MKFTYHFRFSVIITMIICILPISFNCMLAQKEEIPITTSSEEALKLFLEGREKWENIEIAAAALLFDQAIQKDPEFAMAYLYRSQSGGGFNIFRQNLEKAVSLVDKVSEGEKHLILYSQAQADGDGAKQKEHLDQLLKLFPNDKRVQTLAGSYFQYVLDDRETAIKHLKKATDLDKKYAPTYNNLGYAQSALGNYEAAEEAFKTYINLIPDNPNPYDSYAELLLKIGKYDESIE
ncbi:tetratricopeptide repeat protein, partial [candidate division WOR-3 bacterium]|nr:tetratricopeptide repeat protein [candidate division WOR-3 bacterium]